MCLDGCGLHMVDLEVEQTSESVVRSRGFFAVDFVVVVVIMCRSVSRHACGLVAVWYCSHPFSVV